MTGRPIQLAGKLRLTERQHIVFNAVVFQLSWLACVLGGSVVAAAVTAAVVAMHLKVVADKRQEFIFLLQCAAVGFVCDLALIQMGVLNTGNPLPPLWLTCLWVLFGTTVGYPLRFFHGRLALCVAGGFVFAPTSYFGGARLADVTLVEPVWVALLSVGLVWAVVFPTLIYLYSVNKQKTAKT
ncbi:DUF2878 domain-containing protein [Pseudohongiella sp.]|uniref:DUF2878 domain-containing protein n=3 Tax=root TaxID=1 RepID=A0A0F9W6P8_9ZZZZ|nr:DUF2878 domain-containing protein [Pseudohongiella sp.]